MSTLNRHIEVFFGEIGDSLNSRTLQELGVNDCHGAGEGIRRSIEMIRKSKGGREEGSMVLLRLHEGSMEIAVTVWTREKPGADVVRGNDTIFPLSTPPEIIAGFMVSRFPPLP